MEMSSRRPCASGEADAIESVARSIERLICIDREQLKLPPRVPRAKETSGSRGRLIAKDGSRAAKIHTEIVQV